MRKFLVTVNGNKYDVEIDEVGAEKDDIIGEDEAEVKVEAPSEPVKEATEKVESTGKKELPHGEHIKAPLGGTILAVKVSEGDTVKSGDLLMTLEAMKLENEITSPVQGKVLAINTSKGASVSAGDTLIVIG